jgi:hypothetical protein
MGVGMMTDLQRPNGAFRCDNRLNRSLIAVAAVFATCPAFAFDLITNAEFKAEQSARIPLGSLRQPLTPSSVPRIEIAAPPDLSKRIRSPINLEVRFATDPPAVVDPKTLQILYGALRLDITDRIRKAAKVTPTAIVAENAKLPAGSHRLFIGIADSAGRYAEKEVKFESE